MFKRIKHFYSKLDVHTAEVVSKSASSTIVKIAGMILGLAVSIFLGRTIGAEGVGIINLGNRIINILIIISLLGMRQVIIKEVAIAHNKNDWQQVGNIMYTAYFLNGTVSIFISFFLILLSPWISNEIFNEPDLTYPLIIFLVVLPPQVFSRIFSAGLIGYKKIWQSNLVDQTLSIGITALLLLFVWLWKKEVSVLNTAFAFAIGRLTVTISMGFYFSRLHKLKKTKLIFKQLLTTAFPLLLVAVAGVIQSSGSFIIIGLFENTKEIGLFSVAGRIALLTSFFLQVTNASIAPKIAALYERGKIKELEKMAQQVTKGLGIIGFSSLFIFIFFGKYILNFWGEEFVNAYWILVIMGFAQFINISTGAIGLILVMCGYEKIRSKISFYSLLLNLIFLLILTKFWGITGAAIATALSIISLNVIIIYFVKNKIGITTLPVIFKYSRKP